MPQWIYNSEDLRFLDVNLAAQKFYGYSREEFLEMTALDLRTPDERVKFIHFLESVNDSDEPVIVTSVHVTKEGELKLVEVHSRSIPYLNGNARLVTIRDLTENESLREKLKKEKEVKEKEIIHAAIKSQEAEKEFIGKELHDNINQILSSTKLYIEFAQTNNNMLGPLLARCKQNIELAIEEIRQLSKSLVFPDGEGLNLKELVQELAATYQAVNKLEMHLTYEGEIEILPDELKITLFRIIQEQFNNIMKYANAVHVWLSISLQGNLKMQIRDDGKGFDPGKKRMGIGLRNIRNRISYYNGSLEIKSNPGEGCSLLIKIPLVTEVKP